MGRLNRVQTAVLGTIAGALILAGGFVAGQAIGVGDDEASLDQGPPTRISTRQGGLAIPTLGDAERIPTLEATQQEVESPSELEDSSSTFTPSPEPEESPAPEPSPEPSPEVTVAPNG